MHIVMVDDSVPFDGTSPERQPLGGAEKAFAGLAQALARRGHEITVFNRCKEQAEVDGVRWLPWDTPRPPLCDVVLAFRKPALLGEIRGAEHRTLWLAGPVKALTRPVNQAPMEDHKPTLVFVSRRQRAQWKPWRDFRERIIEPAVNPAFRDEGAPCDPASPARAVVTTHPLHGLSWILKAWCEEIHKRAGDAELHVFSAALARAADGGDIDDKLVDVYEQAVEAKAANVVLRRPLADAEMAAEYRQASVHLYPGIETESFAWTLAESQAAGLPAVAMNKGGGTDRVRNGQTGFLVPDTAAFANVATHLLTNGSARQTMGRDARMLQGGRSWDVAAAEFESLWR